MSVWDMQFIELYLDKIHDIMRSGGPVEFTEITSCTLQDPPNDNRIQFHPIFHKIHSMPSHPLVHVHEHEAIVLRACENL